MEGKFYCNIPLYILICNHKVHICVKQHVLLHFQRVPLPGALENIWSQKMAVKYFWKSSFFIKVTGCKNYSKVSQYFKKMANSL